MNLAACGGTFSTGLTGLTGLTGFFLFCLYLPAGRQVLNILSILSKKWNFLCNQGKGSYGK
jgi:hypothetical protein